MKNMFIYYFLVIFIVNATLAVTPEMLLDKGTSGSINSLLYSAFALAVFIFSPFWGKYINDNGVKKLCMYLPLAIAITQVLLLVSPGSFGMLVSKFLTGVFSAAIFLMGVIYINALSKPEDKAKNFGFLMVVMSLAVAIAQISMGIISQYFDGYAYAFIIQLIISVVLIPVAFIIIKEIPTTGENKKSEKVKFKFSPITIMVILMTVAIGIFTANIGYYIILEFSATTAQVGIINGLTFIITMLANLLLIQILFKKFTFRQSMSLQIIGGITSMVAFSIFIITGNKLFLFLAFIVFALALSVFKAIAQEKVVADKPENANVELGFITGGISMGYIFGPLVGAFAFAINPDLMFLTIIILLSVALVIHLKTSNIKEV